MADAKRVLTLGPGTYKESHHMTREHEFTSPTFQKRLMARESYHSPQDAVTKHHRLGSLSRRKLFSHNCGYRKFRVKVPAWSGTCETSFPGLQVATILLRSHGRERAGLLMALLWR